jgi:hypothetical protein
VSIRLSSYLGNAVTRLRASDLEAVLAFVAAAHAIDGPEPFTTELLGRMAELVPCESVFFNERDLIRRDLVSQPDWPAEEPHFDCWPLGEDEWSLIARHPLNIHRRRTGDFGVRHVSDLYSRRSRVRGEIYPEYFGQLGIVDFTGIALSRSQTHTLRFGLESKGAISATATASCSSSFAHTSRLPTSTRGSSDLSLRHSSRWRTAPRKGRLRSCCSDEAASTSPRRPRGGCSSDTSDNGALAYPESSTAGSKTRRRERSPTRSCVQAAGSLSRPIVEIVQCYCSGRSRTPSH